METVKTKFHLRVRAVVFKDGRLLVNKFKSGQNTFLPGGHVEDGESIPKALEREIMEELGEPCIVKKYLGAIENSWFSGETRNWAVNHIFEIEIPGLNPQNAALSKEEGKDMEFLWITPQEFEKYNLLPDWLRDFINNWLNGNQSAWWGSDVN